MATNGNLDQNLTRSQRRAVAALVTSRTIGEAAALVGVGERTVHRWLADSPDFRSAVTRAQSVAVDQAVNRLAQLALTAIEVLEAVMTDPNASHATAVRAADRALSHWLALSEWQTVSQRLADLESVVYGSQR